MLNQMVTKVAAENLMNRVQFDVATSVTLLGDQKLLAKRVVLGSSVQVELFPAMDLSL